MNVLSYSLTLHALEVAAQETIPCWHEGGFTDVYVRGVQFYQNATTFENRTLGQAVLFPVHVGCRISSSRSTVRGENR